MSMPIGARKCPSCLPEGCAYCGGRGYLLASDAHAQPGPKEWTPEHEAQALLESLGGSFELDRSEATRTSDARCIRQAIDNAVANTVEKIALFFEEETGGLAHAGQLVRKRFSPSRREPGEIFYRDDRACLAVDNGYVVLPKHTRIDLLEKMSARSRVTCTRAWHPELLVLQEDR